MTIAFAKKHDVGFFLPEKAVAYNHFRNGDVSIPFYIKPTGENPRSPIEYREPHDRGQHQPYYHELPYMDNVLFRGYFQSFLWFQWCRDYILDTFDFPYEIETGVVSVHVRRGDCVGSKHFPMAPRAYYEKAIRHMNKLGYERFRIFSDDILWCKEEFTPDFYPDVRFEFVQGGNEMQSWIGMQNCEHNITARSTFSLTAAWFNRNEKKIVLVPTSRHRWWRSVNLDLLTDSGFTEIDFEDGGL